MTRAGLARLSTAFVASVCLSGLVASAQGGGSYSAALVPDQEVPAVSSAASGTITLDIDEGERRTSPTSCRYSGLSSTVAQAHIHFAQAGVNGGIVLWLCEGTATPAPALGIDPPTCPQSGTVSGVLTPADVISTANAQNVNAQQINAGEFAEAVALIKKGSVRERSHRQQRRRRNSRPDPPGRRSQVDRRRRRVPTACRQVGRWPSATPRDPAEHRRNCRPSRAAQRPTRRRDISIGYPVPPNPPPRSTRCPTPLLPVEPRDLDACRC